MIQPLVLGLGAPELIIILVIVMVVFGVSRIPDAMQGLGRGLRLFKDETRGLMDDDKAPTQPGATDPHGRPVGQLGSPDARVNPAADVQGDEEIQRRAREGSPDSDR